MTLNNKITTKSQAALEFVILTAFLLAVSLIIIGIGSYFIVQITNSEINEEREVFFNSILEEFNLAASSENSYYREIIIPKHDLDKYEIEFYENDSYITIKDLLGDNKGTKHLYDVGFLFEFNKTFFYEYNPIDPLH